MTLKLDDDASDLKFIRDRALANLKIYEKRLSKAIETLEAEPTDRRRPDHATLLRNYEKVNLQIIDVMLKLEKTKQAKPGGNAPAINFEDARREILAKIEAYEEATAQRSD